LENAGNAESTKYNNEGSLRGLFNMEALAELYNVSQQVPDKATPPNLDYKRNAADELAPAVRVINNKEILCVDQALVLAKYQGDVDPWVEFRKDCMPATGDRKKPKYSMCGYLCGNSQVGFQIPGTLQKGPVELRCGNAKAERTGGEPTPDLLALGRIPRD
jgi:hypothetical protein